MSPAESYISKAPPKPGGANLREARDRLARMERARDLAEARRDFKTARALSNGDIRREQGIVRDFETRIAGQRALAARFRADNPQLADGYEADAQKLEGKTPTAVAKAATEQPTDVSPAQAQRLAGGSAPVDERERIRQLQRDLNAKGATLVVDGIMGPKTRAAMARFGQAASEPGTEAIAAAAGSAASSVPTGGQASPALMSDADARRKILEDYPQLAGFMDTELGPILLQAARDGLSQKELAARVQGTDWWRRTPQKSRAWLGLYALDPATAERQIDDEANRYRQALDDYGVPLADVTLREWAKKSLSGEVPEDGFRQYLVGQAKSLYPTLATALDQGITVAQYWNPYREIAARMLEVAPDSITLSDLKWSKPLAHVDREGNRVPMTLSDWETELRTNPVYGYKFTTQARQQAAELGARIAQAFGRTA